MAHHTPLRRVSQGSLSASASLSSSHPAPSTVSQTGLDFLAPALSDLVDEIEGLHANLLGIGQLSTSLGVFNEGFAGFLYGLRMNAFSVEWPQAPNEISFDLHQNPPTPPPSQTHPLPPSPSSPSHPNDVYQQHQNGNASSTNPADQTYATAYSLNVDDLEPSAGESAGASTRGRGIARGSARGTRGSVRGARGGGRGGGAAGTAVRKKQQAQISALVDTLPLEFRGSQPALRQAMEKIVGALLNSPDGMKMPDIVSSTDLPQPKVNKCLIALVGKKAAIKLNAGGVTVYQLQGI